MQCPLCGTVLNLSTDGIWFICPQCNFNEETMEIEESYTV